MDNVGAETENLTAASSMTVSRWSLLRRISFGVTRFGRFNAVTHTYGNLPPVPASKLSLVIDLSDRQCRSEPDDQFNFLRSILSGKAVAHQVYEINLNAGLRFGAIRLVFYAIFFFT